MYLDEKRLGEAQVNTESEAVAVLKCAKKRIERGWCSRVAQLDDGVCALMALIDAPGSADAYGDANSLFRRAIGDHNIPRWNDAPGRTKAEVLCAFDRAIAGLNEDIAPNHCGRRSNVTTN